MNFKPDVVNLHFIDYCNYSCSYCFVKKVSRFTSFLNIQKLINNISSYFKKNNVRGRINLVGGEVFLCSYLQEIIDYIFSKEVDVSLVTNGSLLTKEFIEANKNKLSSIGISIDSLDHNTNLAIRRCCKGITINQESLKSLCKHIKTCGIKLKINNCASKFNYNEDFSSFIKDICPDRFKIFQMTVIEGINSNSVVSQLSDSEFEIYCDKYKELNPIIESESEMKESYLMIDADGDVYINKDKEALGNALKSDLNNIISDADFDETSFLKRYI